MSKTLASICDFE
ncbi:hypothetical protein F383_22445 [Gossypium arboreum]|uniref:Uncharacterized protein n=1 Tax=Gossypium arboreum TaxID=29729 RepID=A0A0B0P181_GOSAR|nr:hypothetical protein F383_22445 [Gossypium arboreum]